MGLSLPPKQDSSLKKTIKSFLLEVEVIDVIVLISIIILSIYNNIVSSLNITLIIILYFLNEWGKRRKK